MSNRFASKVFCFLLTLVSCVAGAATIPADFNGDGKSDLLWYNESTGQTAIWLMNGGATFAQTLILTDPNWRVTQTGDFNGDGKADLVWYNEATGQTAIWLMNGTASVAQTLILTDPNWKVLYVADFNGDGKSDLLWYNTATGQTAIWLMNGTTSTSQALLLTDIHWYVAATPDLDGDGKADLLWYNSTTGQTSAWLMNGVTATATATLLTDPNWRVTGTADLNGDGKSDLLWYNTPTGQSSVWLMNGFTVTAGTLLLTDPNWKIAGTADFNGDGKADLLWRNASTGQTATWLMNGATALSQTLLLTNFGWSVIGTHDLNGDGKDDLLWFNTGTGQTSAWLMNGTSATSTPLLLTDGNWRQATQPESTTYSVRLLNFTDPSNYTVRYFYSPNIVDSGGVYTYYDFREGLSGGADIPTATLYDSALFATPTGWQLFDNSTPNTSTVGAVSAASYSWGYVYTTTRLDYDVSGWPMATVVALAQSTSGTSTSTLVGVNAGALTGTMPDGSKLISYINAGSLTPVQYRSSDGSVGGGVTSLSSMVATFPVPGTPTGANTVSMGNLHGTAACGATICPQERVRAAFPGGNAVALFLCDLNTSTNVSSNCTAQGSGTYATGVAVDGVTPILGFPTLPAFTAVQTFQRVFVQRNNLVYFGFKDKPSTTTHSRLNYIAFRALAAKLGIFAERAR